MKRKIIPDPLLMLLTILVIISSQAYWLKDNYDRENKTLQIKTNVLFQETVHQLQSVKLKLPYPFQIDSFPPQKSRIFLDDDIDEGSNVASLPRHQVVAMVNTIRDKVYGSIGNDSTFKSTMTFRMDDDSVTIKHDSTRRNFKKPADSTEHIFNVLYRVDSLQDSIKVSEIATQYTAALKRGNYDLRFNITRFAGAKVPDVHDMSKVTVGFARPITYQLSLLHTNGYLFKKILLPALFSLFLIGITILSFILLYRNLLRQNKLAEIKNDFISNITHELKTPIATVGVAIEALKNFNAMQDPHKTKEYLDISSNELQRLGLLVDKVLKLSMFEKKEIELNREPFDLKESIQEVLDTMKLQFEKNNAVVTFNSAGDNFYINADRLHITSVIYNLLDNALKYSREDITITIALSRQNKIFELRVSDNGIGIAKEYRGKIFDKFFRVPTDNRHGVKGYGLGLSYVSEIIQRHKGYIYAESEYGKGSVFVARIPAEEVDVIWFDDKKAYERNPFFYRERKKYEH